jgi:hypothetical protein
MLQNDTTTILILYLLPEYQSCYVLLRDKILPRLSSGIEVAKPATGTGMLKSQAHTANVIFLFRLPGRVPRRVHPLRGCGSFSRGAFKLPIHFTAQVGRGLNFLVCIARLLFLTETIIQWLGDGLAKSRLSVLGIPFLVSAWPSNKAAIAPF